VKLLALDTSSVACSVALRIEDRVVDRHEERPREHTRILLPMVRELLDEAGLSVNDLEGIVLGNGPGSFIGMRIAASVAQGLAFGAGLKVVPVSSLAAVAAEEFATSDAREAYVAQDARMGEVYLGAYERGDAGVPVPLAAERLHDQGPIEEADTATAERRVAAGAGWRRYPELLAVNRQRFSRLSEVAHPRARHLFPLVAAADIGGQGIDPKEIVPAYLRQKVAEKPAKPS
jgi:tRNA threonylcarbamoyladenosine biosynthesis protein TsaB